MVNIHRWSAELQDEVKQWNNAQKSRALFIEQHPTYPAYLLVNSPDPLYVHNLKDVLNQFRAFSKLKLNDFVERAELEGYDNLIFLTDPDDIYHFLAELDTPYPAELNTSLYQFQLRGFNYTKDLPVAIINWSTGTGKSIYSVARAKYLLETNKVDKVIVLSKNHNKINWKRTFDRIGSLVAEVDDEQGGGSPSSKREKRAEMYASADIFIINYEKLRFRDKPREKRDGLGKKRPDSSGDGQELLQALQGQRVLWVWDEITNKMKSMSTGWYKGAEKILRKTDQNIHIALTAKKLDTNPENVYSFVKIMDNTVWPSIAEFRATYAKRMSNFSQWQVAAWDTKKLPELGMRLAHMTHIANKYTDPKIRAEFPQDHWENIEIDMSEGDRRLYQAVESDIVEDLKGDYNTLLTKIIPLQLVCNNPDLINQSKSKLAEALRTKHRFTDKNCAKLEVLRDMLDQIDGKVVIFTMYNDLGVKMLVPYLNSWQVPFVAYTGNNKQKQDAQDRFRLNPNLKVFLSSDAGSDSIDLEQATTVINYDLPWNDSTLVQRVNRISRLTSEADHVFYYNFITLDTLEERKLKVLERKRLLEQAIDSDLSTYSELVTNSSLAELKWIVSGKLT